MTKKEISYTYFPYHTPDDVRQLCYIAYFDEDYGSAVPQYLRRFHTTRKVYDETVLKLQRLGYLQTHNKVMPEHHQDIFDFLVIEHKDWIDTFKSIRQKRHHGCRLLPAGRALKKSPIPCK